MKYIWSYLLILLIPLVLVTVFIYENAVTNLRAEIERSRLDQLTQTKVMIDGRMKELSEIASRISYDKRLTPYRVHDPYYSGEAIQALDQYKATSSIIDEMFLYFHQDENIYSSAGLYRFDVFASHFSFQNWNKEAVFRDLNSVKIPTMRPADLVNRNTHLQQTMLAYLVPITPNSPNPHGTVMYLIRESALTSLIDSILGDYQGQTLILDQNGQILADNRQGESLDGSEASSLFELSPGIHDKMVDGKPHSIVSVKSENNGWTYVTLMPSAQFFSSVLHVRSFIIMLFVIVVAVGAAVALLLARMQYQPISTLVEFAASKSKDGDIRSAAGSSASGNELDRIRTALQEYSSRVDLQEPYARNHFLSLLLKYGNVRNLTPELQDAFDVRFDRSRLFVMVIGRSETGERQEDKPERQDLTELLSRIEFPELSAHAYGVELPQLDRFALIVCFDPDGSIREFSHVRDIVDAVRSNLLETIDVMPMIGVGTCYSSPNQLNQSFIEACSAFELGVSGASGTITYFEQLSYTPEHTFWIPNNILMKLSQSLKQGSYDVATQMIRSAIESLQSSGLSALLKRCISFDILNTMLKTAAELGIHHTMHDIAPNMIYTQSFEELERSLLNLASRICNQVELDKQKEEQSLTDQIAAYIDDHYTDHALSLETVALEFAVSPSHVSRSFKEKMGLNFSQYVWQKRVEEVKRQLTSTSDSLKDIITRVGYLDTPNFIRKFKKETGYTPGQYRKMHSAYGGHDLTAEGE